MGVDVRLLGPIAAFRDGEPGALGGPRQRAVLARLALSAGQVVTVDRLIDDVWVGEPPTTATNTVQSYVSLLRRALGAPELVRRDGPGYVLDVPRDALDVHRFEDGVTAGMAVVRTDPAAALDLLDAALGEWRGPCLADVADMEWARPATVRWDELRLAANEQRYDALLALGRPAEAAGGLERLVDEHPLREGVVRRLMLALYRSGRQADALRAFATTRSVLADELGLDPTPDLQALERAILQHDPALNAPDLAEGPARGVVGPGRRAERRRRRPSATSTDRWSCRCRRRRVGPRRHRSPAGTRSSVRSAPCGTWPSMARRAWPSSWVRPGPARRPSPATSPPRCKRNEHRCCGAGPPRRRSCRSSRSSRPCAPPSTPCHPGLASG